MADEDGLTFCQSFNQPVVISDSRSGYTGLIKVKPSAYSSKARWKDDYLYFELLDDDGAFDKIISIVPERTGFIIKIHREFQEGWNEFDVLISTDGEQYFAEHLNYGEVN
ncbi:MAG: hypothetical protein ACK40G_11800 [Cytophagaceae bacterium]